MNDEKSFWERTWRTVDAKSVSTYVERLADIADPVVDFLKDRGAKRICDAGCGCGAFSLKLARRGFLVSGFDIADGAVSFAKELLSQNGYDGEDFKTSDILSTLYPDASFDAVVARDVIDHLPIKKGAAAIKELLRITRDGGCVIFSLDTTDEEYESEPHEVSEDGDYLYTRGKWAGMAFHPYTPDDIKKLTRGAVCTILTSSESGSVVAIEK